MSLADELLADLGGDLGPEDEGNEYLQVHEVTGDDPMDGGDLSEDRDSVFRVARLIKSPDVCYRCCSLQARVELL